MAACSCDNLALGWRGRSGTNGKVDGLGKVLMVFSLLWAACGLVSLPRVEILGMKPLIMLSSVISRSVLISCWEVSIW